MHSLFIDDLLEVHALSVLYSYFVNESKGSSAEPIASRPTGSGRSEFGELWQYNRC